MSVIRYPSEDFPRIPNIEIETYEGWEGRNLPDSIIGLIKKLEGEFSSNILINVKKVQETFTFKEYMD